MIHAIIWRSRMSDVPLVSQSFNWGHGVYLGATTGSKRLPLQRCNGATPPRPDGHAPFLWLHMGDYFLHWFKMQRDLCETPRVFNVNWFRKDEKELDVLALARICGHQGIIERVPVAPWASRHPSAGCLVTKTWTGAVWRWMRMH